LDGRHGKNVKLCAPKSKVVSVQKSLEKYRVNHDSAKVRKRKILMLRLRSMVVFPYIPVFCAFRGKKNPYNEGSPFKQTS
jgi:hypothetical protein